MSELLLLEGWLFWTSQDRCIFDDHPAEILEQEFLKFEHSHHHHACNRESTKRILGIMVMLYSICYELEDVNKYVTRWITSVVSSRCVDCLRVLSIEGLDLFMNRDQREVNGEWVLKIKIRHDARAKRLIPLKVSPVAYDGFESIASENGKLAMEQHFGKHFAKIYFALCSEGSVHKLSIPDSLGNNNPPHAASTVINRVAKDPRLAMLPDIESIVVSSGKVPKGVLLPCVEQIAKDCLERRSHPADFQRGLIVTAMGSVYTMEEMLELAETQFEMDVVKKKGKTDGLSSRIKQHYKNPNSLKERSCCVIFDLGGCPATSVASCHGISENSPMIKHLKPSLKYV